MVLPAPVRQDVPCERPQRPAAAAVLQGAPHADGPLLQLQADQQPALLRWHAPGHRGLAEYPFHVYIRLSVNSVKPSL